MAVSLTFKETAVDGATKTAYTFSAVDIGTASADRYVLLGVQMRAVGDIAINSVTIGGETATIVADVRNAGGGNTTRTFIASALVISGTTADVVVTYSGDCLGCGIGVFTSTGINNTATDTATSTVDAPTSSTLDVVAGGFAIACAYVQNDGTSGGSWTELTERYDTEIEGGRNISGASKDYDATQTNLSITYTAVNPSSGVSAGSFAAFTKAPSDDVKNHASLPTSLVSYWSLEETSGTRIDAVTGTGNDLGDNGTVTSASGIQGNAAFFIRSNNEYLDISDASQTNLDFGTGAFSVAYWVDIGTLSTTDVTVAKRDSGAVAGYNLAINQSDGKHVVHMRPNGGSSFNASSSTLVPTSGLQQIVFTRDASGNTTFYLNGLIDGTSTGGNNDLSTTGAFQLSGMFGTTQLFDGIIDEVGVWSKELTASEVDDLFQGGSGLPYESLVVEEIAESVSLVDSVNVDAAFKVKVEEGTV